MSSNVMTNKLQQSIEKLIKQVKTDVKREEREKEKQKIKNLKEQTKRMKKQTDLQNKLEVVKLLNRRKEYINPRSYEALKNRILKAKPATLESIQTALKYIKQMENKKLTNSNFKTILNDAIKLKDEKKKEYKVVLYVDKILIKDVLQPRVSGMKKTYKEVEKPLPREAIQHFTITSRKKLNEMLEQKEKEYRENFQEIQEHDSLRYYRTKITGFTHEISPVSKLDVPINKVPMKGYTLRRDWLKYAEGIEKKAYEDMNGYCVYELLICHLKSYWTTVNKEKLFEIFNEYVEQENN